MWDFYVWQHANTRVTELTLLLFRMVCRNDALIFLCFSDWEHNSTRISHNTCFYYVLRISVSPLVPYSLILLVSDLLPAWCAVQFRSWQYTMLTVLYELFLYSVSQLYCWSEIKLTTSLLIMSQMLRGIWYHIKALTISIFTNSATKLISS